METSVKAAKVLAPPQTDVASSGEDHAGGEAAAPAACTAPPAFSDPLLEFSRRLEDIISAHGSEAGLLDSQSAMENETEKTKEEARDDVTVSMETDVSLVMQSLSNLKTAEEKLDSVVRKYAELAALRRCDDKKLHVLQQKLSAMLEERQRLQAERRAGVAARGKLEALCREMQSHYNTMREETLQRCREDEEKRKEITCHFQKMLTEIQAQIEQHSARNDKLCHENSSLTDKLESLMNQCELREESLEKINRHRDLQHKLTEAKLQQATAQLAEAEDKHKREKEYLLREAIDKTKKCFAMKEQELTMKKKLALYAQKFDEFQATLAKSNEIYVRFKKEMDNMSDKMKKMEKESNLWKTRFENCNKALTDMIEERTEKGKEYDLFVLKIQKLEKLCRALQEERKVLYDKIKEVRDANSNLPSKVSSLRDIASSKGADESVLLNPVEIQEIQEEDPVLTDNMTRLREEQVRLQEFAASLLSTPADNDKEEDDEEIDLDEDIMASAFMQFKTKPKVKEEPAAVPEQVEDVKTEAAETDQKPDVSKPEAPIQVEVKEVQQVKAHEEIQPQPSEQEPTPETEKVHPPTEPKPEAEKVDPPTELKPEAEKVDPPTELKPEAEKVDPPTEVKLEAETPPEPIEVKPAVPVNVEELQQHPVEPAPASEETPNTSESAAPSETSPSSEDSSKKQAPKKKKKKPAKSSS